MRFKLGRRLLYLGIGATIFLVTYSVGTVFPLSEEEAAEVRKQFAEQIEGIDAFGIFLNNFRIALIMFIPGAGAVFGGVAGFATGTVFSAIQADNPELAGFPPQLIFLLPFGAMELFVYAMAMSRSGLLMMRLAKDKPWRPGKGRPFYDESLKPTFIELGIAAVVLFAAAIIEWELVQLVPEFSSNGRT